MYDIDGITKVDEIKIDTPYGAPSDKYTIATIDGLDNVEVAFLPRHGQGHVVTPTEVNYRANVYGMKKLGVSWALSVTAVGSLQMEYPPGHMVLVNQFIDRTQHRQATFFGEGLASHVPFGEPICGVAREYLREACEDAGATYHVSISRATLCFLVKPILYNRSPTSFPFAFDFCRLMASTLWCASRDPHSPRLPNPTSTAAGVPRSWE